ncbi:MAG: 30S ribosomal protein S1, partial [Rhabdochlamydiaceae bacterium]
MFDSYMSNMDSEISEGDSSYRKLSKGETILARVVQIEADRIFVDLGTKSEGVIPIAELGSNPTRTGEELKIGDTINVVVVKPEGGDRQSIVSKKRADFELIWTHIEEAKESGEMITATVLERIKGGLVVDVGVRGFVPATHVGSGKLRNIDKYVGQELKLKVIEIDRERKKVVLSNREAEEQRRAQVKEDIFSNVKVSDVLDGTVRRLTDYGAFIDLGGVDGLLHISEMSWSRISHPREIFKEGQKIKVQVLRLDQETGKISLGHRQVLPDPWNLVKENYKIGETIKITITRLVASGAFIKLPEGAEAFMPMSEMSNQRIHKPDEAVTEGAEVEARIIDLKADQRRMVLSLREGSAPGGYQSDIPGQDRRDMGRGRGGPGGPRGRRSGRPREGNIEDYDEGGDKRRGISTSGATIGERLGALHGFFRPVDDHGSEVKHEGEAEGATQKPDTSKSKPAVAKSAEAKVIETGTEPVAENKVKEVSQGDATGVAPVAEQSKEESKPVEVIAESS